MQTKFDATQATQNIKRINNELDAFLRSQKRNDAITGLILLVFLFLMFWLARVAG